MTKNQIRQKIVDLKFRLTTEQPGHWQTVDICNEITALETALKGTK